MTAAGQPVQAQSPSRSHADGLCPRSDAGEILLSTVTVWAREAVTTSHDDGVLAMQAPPSSTVQNGLAWTFTVAVPGSWNWIVNVVGPIASRVAGPVIIGVGSLTS